MKYSLKTKLTLSYMLVAFMSIFIMSICANLLLDKYFRAYVSSNQEKSNSEIVTNLAQQYTQNKGWYSDFIEPIGVRALENGTIIRVKDQSGHTIWDAKTHNNGMCQGIILEMSKSMNNRYPFMKGTYKEIPYPIYSNMKQIGVVEIGVYGPYYLNRNDLVFINSLNKFLLLTAFISLLFSIGIGTIMAKKISLPISTVINSADSLSKGLFSNKIELDSNTKEISQLTNTINDLADTLNKQDQLRKRLTSDVSHELRTPLATLRSHLEAMIDGIWEPSKEKLNSCQEEIMRMHHLIGDLEALTKIEGESIFLNKTGFNLDQLIIKAVELFELEASRKHISMEVNTSEAFIYADKDKIYQVLLNLISNALKFTSEGGHISLSNAIIDDKVKIYIKDNGIGIDEKDQPLIFERFYRTDQSRARKTGGAGIGLTITKSLIDAHKGSIEVNSALNSGSEFIVTIPYTKTIQHA